MLPDFSETKRLFSRFFRTYMRRKDREFRLMAPCRRDISMKAAL